MCKSLQTHPKKNITKSNRTFNGRPAYNDKVYFFWNIFATVERIAHNRNLKKTSKHTRQNKKKNKNKNKNKTKNLSAAQIAGRAKTRQEKYDNYIYKVLKQVHPEMSLSKQAMEVMNEFCHDTFDRLMQEAANLLNLKNKKVTLEAREV